MREDKTDHSKTEGITSDDDAGEHRPPRASSLSSSSSSLTSLLDSSESSSESKSLSNTASSSKTRRKHKKRCKDKEVEHKYKRKVRQMKEKLRKHARSGFKAKQPSVYNRKADFDVFEQWVFKVDNWLYDTGYKKKEAVRHIGNFLSGGASKWYMSEVATNLRKYDVPRLYQNLFEHSFPYNYKAKLCERLNKATQGKKDVREYLRELKTLRSCLTDITEQQLRQRFWDGSQLYLRLKWTKAGLNPEDSDLRKLERAALCFERAEQIRRTESKRVDRSNLTRPDKEQNMRARSRSPRRYRTNKDEDKATASNNQKRGTKPEHNEKQKPYSSAQTSQRKDKLSQEQKDEYRAAGKCSSANRAFCLKVLDLPLRIWTCLKK